MSWGIGCTLIGSQTNLMYEYSIVMILNEYKLRHFSYKDRQSSIQVDEQTLNIQIDRQAERQTDRQLDRLLDRHAGSST